MNAAREVHEYLAEAMVGAQTALAAADALCGACVEVLGVDGAAISYLDRGTSSGTFGSSAGVSRLLDELQFTFGEGPCRQAAAAGTPIFVADLADPAERRWPAYAEAVLAAGVRAVFAFPSTIAASRVGALELFHVDPGPLTEPAVDGAMIAADLAAVALLDLMTANAAWERVDHGGDGWGQLASLQRVEVYQATGMIVGALGVRPAEALARLRGYAFAQDMTASEVAWNIIERHLTLEPDEGWSPPGTTTMMDR